MVRCVRKAQENDLEPYRDGFGVLPRSLQVAKTQLPELALGFVTSEPSVDEGCISPMIITVMRAVLEWPQRRHSTDSRAKTVQEDPPRIWGRLFPPQHAVVFPAQVADWVEFGCPKFDAVQRLEVLRTGGVVWAKAANMLGSAPITANGPPTRTSHRDRQN